MLWLCGFIRDVLHLLNKNYFLYGKCIDNKILEHVYCEYKLNVL